MTTRTANPKSGTVACEPFQSNSLEIRRVNGVTMPNQRDHLSGLKVIYGTAEFQEGDIVYFEGDQCANGWAKKVLVIPDLFAIDKEGKPLERKFVLAPIELIRLVERKRELALDEVKKSHVAGGPLEK